MAGDTPTQRGSLKSAIVCKPLTTMGGLEQYIFSLAQVIEAPIYTPIFDIPTSKLGSKPRIVEFGKTGITRRVLGKVAGGLMTSIDYENFDVPERHNVIISVGEPAKSVIHQPHQLRIHLLNMPPRWLFDLGPGRLGNQIGPVKWGRRLYQSYVRILDISTMDRLNNIVVPSETIGNRLRTYYGRSSAATIYPPIDTDTYYHETDERYLLYLGRLAPMKRVDEIIEAVSQTDYRLKVAGEGPSRATLEAEAASNIDFLGYVSEEDKRELLAHCSGLLFNSDHEAFGIVPVEAFASGKPVIGVNEGFTRHQIISEKNGLLYQRGRENIIQAIERLSQIDWNPLEIQETAERFDIERFRENWLSLLDEVAGNSDS